MLTLATVQLETYRTLSVRNSNRSYQPGDCNGKGELSILDPDGPVSSREFHRLVENAHGESSWRQGSHTHARDRRPYHSLPYFESRNTEGSKH